MALQPHPWVVDENGDCTTCVLPERHPVHAAFSDAPAKPGLRPVSAPDARVGLHQPGTSHEAAARALPRVGTTKRAIFALIANRPNGCTDDELEVLLDKTHQSVSAARNSLGKDGWIEPLKDHEGHHVTRKTRSGNDAYAWTLTAAARAQRPDLSERTA